MAKGESDVVDSRYIFWRNSAIPQGLPLHMYTNPRLRNLIVNWTIQSFNVTKALNQLLPKSVYPLAENVSGWSTTRGQQTDSVVPVDQHRIWSSLYRPFRISVPLHERLHDTKGSFNHSRVCLPKFTSPSFLSFERSKSYSSISTNLPRGEQAVHPLPGGRSPQWKLPRSMSMLSLRSPSVYSISPIHWLGSVSKENLLKSSKGSSRTYTSESDRTLTRFGRGSLEYTKTHSRRHIITNNEQHRLMERSTISTEDEGGHTNYNKFQRTIDSACILQGRKMVSNRRMQDESFTRVSEAFDRPNLICNSKKFSVFSPEDTINEELRPLPQENRNSRFTIPDVPNFHYAMYNDVTYVRLILNYATTKGSGWNTVCDPVRNKFDMMNAVQIDMAAVTIQSAVRAYCARKKRLLVSQLISFFIDANEAATKIQAQWRTFKARNELQKRKYLRRILKARSKAAIIIQRAYRKMREKELLIIRAAVETQLITRHVCASVLQKNWRGYRARRRLDADQKLFSLRWPYDGPNHVVEVVGTFTAPAWKIRSLLSWDRSECCYVLHMTRKPGTFEIQFIIDGSIVIHGGFPIVDDIIDNIRFEYTNQPAWYKKKKAAAQKFPGIGMRNLLTIENEDKRYEAVLSFRRFLKKHTRNTMHLLLRQEGLPGFTVSTDVEQGLNMIPPYSECNIDGTLSAVEEDANTWWNNSVHPISSETESSDEVNIVSSGSNWYNILMKSAAATWMSIKLKENQYVNYANCHNGNVVIALYAIFLIGTREKLSPGEKLVYNECILNRVFQRNRRPTLLTDAVWEDTFVPRACPIFVNKLLQEESVRYRHPHSAGSSETLVLLDKELYYDENRNISDLMSILDKDSLIIEDTLSVEMGYKGSETYSEGGSNCRLSDIECKATPRPFVMVKDDFVVEQHYNYYKIDEDDIDREEHDIYYCNSSIEEEDDIDCMATTTVPVGEEEVAVAVSASTHAPHAPHVSIIEWETRQRLHEENLKKKSTTSQLVNSLLPIEEDQINRSNWKATSQRWLSNKGEAREGDRRRASAKDNDFHNSSRVQHEIKYDKSK